VGLISRQNVQAARAFKALGEPRRIELLELLRAGPKAVGELAGAVDISQQAVSQHLAVLFGAGLVEATRQGTRNVYTIRQAGFLPVESFVRSFWTVKLAALKHDIERQR
jgi:DNA-binding transcriptional ArsR family regulator